MPIVVLFLLGSLSLFSAKEAEANSVSLGSDGIEVKFTHLWNRIETGVFFLPMFFDHTDLSVKSGVRHEIRLLKNHPWLQLDAGFETMIMKIMDRNIEYGGLSLGPTLRLSLRYGLSERIYIKTTFGLSVSGNIAFEAKNTKRDWLVSYLAENKLIFMPSWQIIGFEWDCL
jgi:hypothetical protein